MASKYNKSSAELESDKFKSAGSSPSHSNLNDALFNQKVFLSPMSVNSFDELAEHIRKQADSLQAVIRVISCCLMMSGIPVLCSTF